MSGGDEWCDVACALEGLAGSEAPMQDDWEVLGKNGTPQSRKKKVTDITPTVSLEDLAAAPGSKKESAAAAADAHAPAALDTSTELTTDGEEEDDDDKMMSSTLTASTSPGSTGGASSVSSPDRLASAAIRLASQANNAFIHEMDKIFDPEAAYPGGNAVHIPSNKESQGGGGVDAVAKNVAKSAQKIVGNLVNQFGQNNTVQQAACGKAPERSTGGGEER